MNNTIEQYNAFLEMPIHERKEFTDKLLIAAQHGYFPECSEVVNMAEREGLYERIKPISANHSDIKDLDNPISNTVNY